MEWRMGSVQSILSVYVGSIVGSSVGVATCDSSKLPAGAAPTVTGFQWISVGSENGPRRSPHVFLRQLSKAMSVWEAIFRQLHCLNPTLAPTKSARGAVP